jgi:PII-like signaling protein/predicted transcriptional regulator
MSGEAVQRVRFYLNERDMREGQPLYLALMERLQREGATGATALRGLAGFGPGHRMRASGIVGVSETQPVVIEWVDRVDRVARVMPALDDLIEEALVTIEDLFAYRARLRAGGVFGAQTAGELLAAESVAASSASTLRSAVAALLAAAQQILPVIDADRRVVAVLSSADLELRARLPLPVAIMRALKPGERDELLASVSEQPVGDLVTDEPRTAYHQAAIPQVVATLLEWGLDALPVIDREGAYMGMVGTDQALQAALGARRSQDGPIRDAETSPHVRLLMQTSVATIDASADTPTTLRQLLLAPERSLIVLDGGAPVGVVDAAEVLSRLEEPLRYAWLQALRAPIAPTAFAGADPELTAARLAAPPALISELATQDDAIREMLTGQRTRLVVVNESGQLVGLLAKRALLRALAQLGG